ncbi:DUF6950 family protein [Xanthobacter sediminis]
MSRVKHWPDRLEEVIAAYQGGVFAWGERDCFRLTMDVTAALTGTDPYADLEPYDSETGAARRLVERGFTSLGDALAAVLPEVPPSMARRGDVGVVDEAGTDAGVVVIGADVVGMSQRGLMRVPRSRLVRAFRVG